MKTLSLVVPYYNEEKNLESCIHSILCQSEPPDEVIFVDNNSSDNSPLIVGDHLPSFKFPVRNVTEDPQGIPFVRNRGVRESASEIVAFLDGDCIAPEDYVESLLRGFEQKVHAVIGRYLLIGCDARIAKYRELTWAEQFGWDLGRRVVTSLNDQDGTIVCGCSAFSKDTLTRLGLFDTRFLFMDDVVISEKFYRMGNIAFMNPDIRVQHKIDTREVSLFKKDLKYGCDHALLNLYIKQKRTKFYPLHYRNMLRYVKQAVLEGDQLASYHLRTLVYHKIGLFLRGLSIGGLYL